MSILLPTLESRIEKQHYNGAKVTFSFNILSLLENAFMSEGFFVVYVLMYFCQSLLITGELI